MLRLFGRKSQIRTYTDSEARVAGLFSLLEDNMLFASRKRLINKSQGASKGSLNIDYDLLTPVFGVLHDLSLMQFDNGSRFSIELKTSTVKTEFILIESVIEKLFNLLGPDSNGLKPHNGFHSKNPFGQISYAWELDRQGKVVDECPEDSFWLGVYITAGGGLCSLVISDCQTFMSLEDIIK